MSDIKPIVPLTGELAMPEKVWMQGPPGEQGQQGEPGEAATVTVGTVTTGEPGTDAIVRNSGTESAAVLNFTIPRGATGATGPSGADGVSPTVSTNKSGNVTTITIVDASGTKTATINDGAKGDTGPSGPAGAGVPDGGTAGQLLSKTESGTAWIDPPQSGVQSDWNQNDDTQPDYVKNRPFYTDAVETALVEETTVSFVDNSGLYVAGFPSTFKATAGETYKVHWDGTAYECVCENFNNRIPIIGNKSIIGFGSDTGEPFIIFNESGQNETGWASITTETSASHTLSISGFVIEVVKVDEKYLPEITADKLPTIPADKLPTIPADKLPTIPADKLPTIPVIEFTTSISANIANATQPYFTVSNLSYSEIYSIVEKGNFRIKDSGGYSYRPIKYNVDTSGNIFVDILVTGSHMNYANLFCATDQTTFYRDGWWQIEATQK